MKDNYKNAIRSITAPDSLIENAIENMQNAKTEACAVEKPKHTAIKFTSAVAAVLALIIGLNFIPFGANKPDGEHNFVITVGAAEITPETYISLGNLEESNESALFRYLDEDLKKVSVLELGREFNVDIQCSGENIESITYTANNGYLRYDPSFSGLIDFTEVREDVSSKYVVHFPDSATSCTYDYNNQPRSFWDVDEMGFEIPEDGFDGTVPLTMCVRFKFDEGEHVYTLDDEDYVDLDDVVYNEFNLHADDYSLDVTANFTDGTQVTKTLKFMCDDSMTQLQLLVTEVSE
ncbi:MAG: hypothetical protein IJD68_00175 [Ruminococcus sp.]|nr:hypothetical protein [Ruminococcus sp.]